MLIPVLIVAGLFAVLVTLEERSGLLHPGAMVPDVSVARVSGERVPLRSFLAKGPVILVFYPRDFTAGCTQEVCAFRDAYKRVARLGATVIGVSRDGADSHRRVSSAYDLPFELVTDRDGSVQRAFGVQRFGGRFPLAKRVTYVIGRDGLVLRRSHHELLMRRHVDDAIRALEGAGK